MQEFNPRGFTTPPQNPPKDQPPPSQTSQGVHIEDVTKNIMELITNEITEMQQDPKVHHMVNTMMKLNQT